MSIKVLDYFNYAIVKQESVNANETGNMCFNSCGKEEWSSQCCATISMYEESDNTVSYLETCMDRVVADQNIGVWIDDFYATLECSGDNSWTRSGAKTLAFGASVSTLLVSMASLF